MSAATKRSRMAISHEPSVAGPDGIHMTFRDLPPPTCSHWVMRRKAQVVIAVRGGLLTLEQAMRRYGLTRLEYEAWASAWDRHGMPGLRTTRLKDYRASSRHGGPRGSRPGILAAAREEGLDAPAQ